MFRTPKVGTRALAGIATIATVTGLTLPLMATAASAAVTSVTVNPATYQAAAGSTVNVTADVVRTAGDATPIRFAIVAGPDADASTNGTLVADGAACGVAPAPPATTAVATCAVANTKGPGTDTVRVFADTNSNLVIDAGEPSSDATVVFYGAAAAVDIKPDSDSAAAGTCNAFTVTVTDAGGRARPGQVVNLEATLTGTTAGRNLAFCDPDGAGTATNAGGDNTVAANNPPGTTTQAIGTVTTGSSTTDATVNGRATFGIRSDEPGTATVRAYIDNAPANGAFDAGEPSDTSTKTFTAGGAGGNSAQDAVATLTVAPTSQSAIVGDPVTYTVTARNAAGDTTPNVLINYTITGANATSGTLTATDNNGQATLTYTPANAGTDTVTFFVNQTTGATGGADANEPKATATTTVTAAPSGNTIDLTCTGTIANTSPEDCVDPTTDNTEVFTAFVSKGTNANGPIPVQGILVRFTTTGTNATVSPTSAVTNAQGIATTTLTDTTNGAGTTDTVTATIAGQSTPLAPANDADSGTKTWQSATPTTVTVAPALNTTQTGTSSTFVATVTDQFGAPVVGQNVDFYISGRNAGLNGPATLNKTTDANGKATLTYTDTGAANTASNDTITAVADVDNNDVTQNTPQGTATNRFITEPATAGTVDLDVRGVTPTNCGVTATDPANDAASYAPSTATHSVCALVKTAGGQLLTGKTVTFTLSGVGSFAKADGTALTSPQTVTTDANGVATILVTSTKSGAQNITATIDGKSDTGTITYTSAQPQDARNVDLKPNSGDLLNGSNELTALVTDRFGNPVSGIFVEFTESGPGQFSNGTSSISGTTGATGTVSVTFTSAPGTTGTDTVTATISGGGGGSAQCTSAAGQEFTYSNVPPFVSTTPAPGATAGNCTDSSTYTLNDKAAGKTPTISILNPVINIGKGGSGVGVTGTPGHTVQLLAYSRPSTTYQVVRTGKFDANGQITFTVSPRTNTRLFAKDVTSNLSSSSGTISVHPALSLKGSANGKVGSFSGTYVPGQQGAAIRLFTVKNGVLSKSPVGTATTDAAGHWTFSRTFAASGPVTFIVQSLANLTNASGQGNRVTITFS